MTDFPQTCIETAALHAEILESLAGELRSPRLGHSGSGRSSTQENILIARDEINQEWQEIETWAAELAWRGNQLDGNPAMFIAARWAWAIKHYPAHPAIKTNIQRIHARWSAICKTTAQKTGTTCPRCGQPLYTATETTIYCLTCNQTRTIEENTALTHHRILNESEYLTAPQVWEQYGIPFTELRLAHNRGDLQYYKAETLREYHPERKWRNCLYFNTLEIEKLKH